MTFDYPAIVTRCTNNYGPYQFPEKVIPLFVTNLLDGRTVPLYGTGSTSATGSTSRTTARPSTCSSTGRPGQIYNIGADAQMTNLELTRRILADRASDETSIDYVDRPNRTRPPLRRGLLQDPGAGLGASPLLRRASGGHGRVVCRPRGLVAADQGSRRGSVKGIILAGGAGTRLDPMTRVASKQLQPVYDKPMVYYPIATLMEAGISEILVITTPVDRPRFEALLGDGSQFGVSFRIRRPGRAEGHRPGVPGRRDFLAGDPVALVLGDNIFYGELGFDDRWPVSSTVPWSSPTR